MRASRSFTTIATAMLLAAPLGAQATIGDPLIPRTVYDSYASFILVSPFTFPVASIGQAVTGVSIFNGFIGRDFTPLLLASSAPGTFTITGVGTQRVVAASGLQSYSFGLTQGSNIVTANTLVGFQTGAAAGVIPFDFDADGNVYAYSANGGGSTTLGATFAQQGTTDRAYSIQFSTTAVSAVPEPASIVLVASGLALVGFVRRRRSV